MKKVISFKNRQVSLFIFLLAFSFFSLVIVTATSSIIPSVRLYSNSNISFGYVNSSEYWGNLFKTVGTNFYGSTCSGGTVAIGTYGNGSLVCTSVSSGGSSYNSTYATWSYNQTTPAINSLNSSYGKFWYNMSDGTGGSGSSYNETYALYAYNHTSLANTSIVNAYGKWFYNMTSTNNANSYNATYELWAYNQTTPAITILNSTYGLYWTNQTFASNLTIFNTYDSRWSTTYNLTYALWTYNQTYSGSTFNTTYASFAYNHTSLANTTLVNAYGKWWYNQTYSGSTFNNTYNTWSYNQTTPAVNSINNSYGSLWNNYSAIKLTTQQTSQANLSNIESINFTKNDCYITTNASCIMLICGGTLDGTCK